jgi:hypothetical protein
MSDAVDRLRIVAETLSDMLEDFLFVGGSVTEFHITDAGGRKTRPTKDLDCVVEVVSRVEYHKLETRLRKAGYKHDPGSPPVICRWVRGTLVFDVMPTDPAVLGFSNAWYSEAIRNPVIHVLPTMEKVRLINPVFFFATKTEAFKDRGRGDFLGSTDFEDILTVVNGREELVEEMKGEAQVRKAMGEYWLPLLELDKVQSAIQGHVDAYEDTERSLIVIDRFRKMFGGVRDSV